jgi:hypothetical protein
MSHPERFRQNHAYRLANHLFVQPSVGVAESLIDPHNISQGVSKHKGAITGFKSSNGWGGSRGVCHELLGEQARALIR